MAKSRTVKKPTSRSKKPISKTKPLANTTKDSLVKTKRKSIRKRLTNYLTRRPHRSFRLTQRRDYVRSLTLPGYWAFTTEVWRVVISHKRLFGSLALLYAAVGVIFVGFASQDAYDQLSDVLSESGGTILAGGWGEFGKAALLLTSGLSGSFAPQLTDVQQVYAGILGLLAWLTTVWLLRSILNGHTPRLRDGIYSAGSPIVATTIVLVILMIQLIPGILAAVVLNVASSTGILDNGFVSLIFWVIGLLLALISAYWAVSTLIALVVVTLPGMYPWRAIQTAGDLVIGRRLRILLRLLWMSAGIAVSWIVVVLPTILIDRSLKSWLVFLDAVPFVPIAISLVTSAAVVWSGCYIYLLYRKVVDDDAKPA